MRQRGKARASGYFAKYRSMSAMSARVAAVTLKSVATMKEAASYKTYLSSLI